MSTLCSEIDGTIGALFTCSENGAYVRIRTPFLYPDGDVIDLFAQNGASSTLTLTDLGETLRWLRMQSLSQKRSPKQNRLIEDVVLTHGVELFRGMLNVRARRDEPLAPHLIRLAQAAIRVADLWFTLRTRAVESITDEVADFLTERRVTFDRGEGIPGRSGRVWRPDFHTRMSERSSLVHVLSTGSRAAARGIVEHVLASWYDLSHLKLGPESLRFVSLFDDTSNVWAEEDFKLVTDLSDVALWSKPEDLIEKIAA